MLSRFMDVLKMEQNGWLLDVCGPIEWAANEEKMEMRVVVQQGRSIAAAQSPPEFTPGSHPDEWEFDAPVQGRGMRPGPAVGLAWAKVTDSAGTETEQNWFQAVTVV